MCRPSNYTNRAYHLVGSGTDRRQILLVFDMISVRTRHWCGILSSLDSRTTYSSHFDVEVLRLVLCESQCCFACKQNQ